MIQFAEGEICVASEKGLKRNGNYVELIESNCDGSFEIKIIDSLIIAPGDLIIIIKKIQPEDFSLDKKTYKRYYEKRWVAFYNGKFILIRQGSFKKAKNAICTP